MDVRIKVSTDAMGKAADQVSTAVKAIETQWNNIENIVRKSKHHWEGQSSDRHQNLLEVNKDEVESVLRRLKEHPVDLLKMAGIYEEAEQDAIAASAPLQSDVIF